MAETETGRFKAEFPKAFQTDILRSLVQSKRFVKEFMGTLKPEYFEKQLDMFTAQAIFKIYLASKQLPTKSGLLYMLTKIMMKEVPVKDEKQKTDLVLKPLQKHIKKLFAPVSNIELIRKEVLNFCQVQDIKRSCLEVYEELEKERDPLRAKALMNKKLRQVNTLESGGLRFFKVIDELHEMLYRDKSRCCTTGYKTLDKWMDGGMDPGTETVFMAPAKFGKSMALVNVGFSNLLRGKIIVHFTLEISEAKIARRYACRIARVRRIENCPKKVAKRVNKFYQQFKGQLFIKGYPAKSATVETIKSYLYSLHHKHDIKPDMIIVDYGDLLRSYAYSQGKQGESERFVQGDVFEGLRAMAQEFDCVLVTATQCNRNAATKPIIRMEDVAESYAKVQIADHIVAICGTDEERKQNRLRLFFAGSREAETQRQIRILFNWKKSVMREVEMVTEEEEKNE